MIYLIQGKQFWLDEVTTAIFSYLDDRGISEDEVITCAAGMTPSCPIHFGILREVIISHYVCEEIKRKGRKARLIYYWDDYDHFCKIPYFTTKEKIEEHIGKPLVEVPDPDSIYPSYGEHYMRVFEEHIGMLGIQPEYNYQSKDYAQGKYAEYIRIALRKRKELFAIIYDVVKKESNDAAANEYYPLEVYCNNCGKDYTRV
jgi:lysyl-tRNA synthetase class 1